MPLHKEGCVALAALQIIDRDACALELIRPTRPAAAGQKRQPSAYIYGGGNVKSVRLINERVIPSRLCMASHAGHKFWPGVNLDI